LAATRARPCETVMLLSRKPKLLKEPPAPVVYGA
jgi:hypothetical protein